MNQLKPGHEKILQHIEHLITQPWITSWLTGIFTRVSPNYFKNENIIYWNRKRNEERKNQGVEIFF
jgi:hypothetical protein